MRRELSICFALLLLLSTVPAVAQNEGAEIYKKQCIKCHGEGGKGDGEAATLLGIPMGDLTAKDAMAQHTDEDLLKIVTEGGRAMGKSRVMAAFKGKLTEDQIKAVVAYVKRFFK